MNNYSLLDRPEKAVFLDRDGVINRAIIENGKPYPPLKISKVFAIDGAKELIKKCHDLDYITIVITNQPDIANHLVDKRTVDKINDYLKSLVGFDDVFVCPHNDKSKCECRKPNTGLFKYARAIYGFDFSKSITIGDRWKDIEAGKNAGTKTIFVDYGYNEKKPESPDFIVKDIKEISKILEGL